MGDIVEQHRHRAQVAARGGQASPAACSSSDRSPVTSRRRRIARPPMVRPSTSMKRLPRQRAVRRKASPRSLSCSRALSTAAASAGTKPGAEGKRPLGRGALADDGGIALEARLAVASVPAHEQLPLGAHQQGGEVVGAAQGREFVAEPALGSPGAPALAHQQQGGGGREGDQAHEQAEIDGVVQIEAAQESRGDRSAVSANGSSRSSASAAWDVPASSNREQGYAARAGGRESRRPFRSPDAPLARPCRAALSSCGRQRAKFEPSPATSSDATEATRLRMNGTAGTGMWPKHRPVDSRSL